MSRFEKVAGAIASAVAILLGIAILSAQARCLLRCTFTAAGSEEARRLLPLFLLTAGLVAVAIQHAQTMLDHVRGRDHGESGIDFL